ncbi:hypothetical protein ADUPG1_000793, partial [Aduncisulcus paluster]
SLAILNINATSIVLPDTSEATQLIPDSLVQLRMYDTATIQAGFDTQVGSSHLSGLKMIDLGNTTSITSIDSLSTSLETLYIADTTSISDLQLTLNSMSSLHSVKFDNIGLSSIPDLSLSSSTLISINLSNNSDISSIYPLVEQGLTAIEMFICNNCSISDLSPLSSMSALKTFECINCSISDLSPLYSLPNLLTINVVGNNICMGSESTEDLAGKFHNYGDAGFRLALGSDLATDQTCDSTGCSSIAYTSDSSCTPIADNLVCSETKPGSNTWYVVCASDSYTSYTSAEDFSCTQPDSSTTNCFGGCEYGYECRYLGDEVVGTVSYSTGECQQVIVDENLHDCVADMFGTDANGDPDYTHRTATSPSLFSVASLKTL